MKKYIIFLFLVLAALRLPAQQDRISVIREKLAQRDMSTVLVTAHRGDWRNFPENSLAAIDNAIKMGVDIVELDIARTADGVLILMHDRTLDRTTTGKGKVSETPLAEIRKLKLKNGCNIRTIHPVPTLEEALLHAKGKIMINLDKAAPFFDEIYPLLVKTGTARQIIMKGRATADEVKKQYGDYLKEVIYMPVVDLDKPGAEELIDAFVEQLNPVAFELLYVNDENPLPAKLAKKLEGKALIWYNTLWDTMAGGHDDDRSLADPDQGYGYLIDILRCRILQTDRPAYLIDYLRRRGLHN